MLFDFPVSSSEHREKTDFFRILEMEKMKVLGVYLFFVEFIVIIVVPLLDFLAECLSTLGIHYRFTVFITIFVIRDKFLMKCD